MMATIMAYIRNSFGIMKAGNIAFHEVNYQAVTIPGPAKHHRYDRECYQGIQIGKIEYSNSK